MATTTYRRVWTLDDRAESVWHSLPVDIPPGCEGLTVRLTEPPPGAVIDIGCEGAAGWRGWSGGARRSYAITPSVATPGYVPGELEPGVWWVVLGLHRIPAEGVELVVEATTGPVAHVPGLASYESDSAAVVVPPRPARRELPSVDGLRWVAADLHAHTLHSDGSAPVAAVAALGVAAGLDVMAITDHNTEAHHAELLPVGERFGIGLIPGQEITTDSGHANAFGAIGVIDFRQPAETWVAEVARRGGLMSINHPLCGDCSWRQPLPVHPPLAELWHSSWLDRRWGGPVAFWHAWGASTTAIGGSDWHNPSSLAPPGSPTTWVAVDAAVAGPDELPGLVLAGLAAGRTSVSAGYAEPVLLRNGDTFVAVDAPGTLLLGWDGSRRAVRTSYEEFPAELPGAHILIDHTGQVLALSS